MSIPLNHHLRSRPAIIRRGLQVVHVEGIGGRLAEKIGWLLL
jgi:hypothetical protein